uniref:Uncharacterized protein n=1 Tax=Arundo donax TaxID=35708 RepID=A0A0A9BS46_ARUDO
MFMLTKNASYEDLQYEFKLTGETDIFICPYNSV